MPESRARARTPWLIKHVMNPIFSRTGTFPILTVHGRRTGKALRTPINVVELDGARYVTSPRGETGWSRNLRANADCSLTIKGREQPCRASEVPVDERPRIIKAYLAKYGNQTRPQFAALPDPVDHPTFRLDPM